MDKYMALMTLMSAAGMLLAVKGWRGRNRTEKQPVPVRVQSDERQPPGRRPNPDRPLSARRGFSSAPHGNIRPERSPAAHTDVSGEHTPPIRRPGGGFGCNQKRRCAWICAAPRFF